MAKGKGATLVMLVCATCNSTNYFVPKTRNVEGKLSRDKYCKHDHALTKHDEKKMPNTKPQAQKR